MPLLVLVLITGNRLGRRTFSATQPTRLRLSIFTGTQVRILGGFGDGHHTAW